MSHHGSCRPQFRFRPQVECLEARAVPSTTPILGKAALGPALLRRTVHRATVDVTSQVAVKLGPQRPRVHTIREAATLTNTGRGTIFGPVCLVVRGLDSRIQLFNLTGTLGLFFPGSPYVARNIQLAPGHSATYRLVFRDPASLPLQFSTAVLGVKLLR
jgi:hypothetical protein